MSEKYVWMVVREIDNTDDYYGSVEHENVRAFLEEHEANAFAGKAQREYERIRVECQICPGKMDTTNRYDQDMPFNYGSRVKYKVEDVCLGEPDSVERVKSALEKLENVIEEI